MSTDCNTTWLRAMRLIELGRHKEAEGELRGAVASDPEDSFLHAMLARCLYLQDRNKAALAETDEAIRLGPDEDLGYFVRSLILLDDRKFKPALEAAKRAVELDNQSADNLGLLGRCYERLNRWPEALEAADMGLAADPQHARCAAVRADALRALGRSDEARATLRESIEDDPEDAFTHASLGWHALREGERGEAMVHFREALRLQPQMLYARQGLAAAMQSRSAVYGGFFRFHLWLADKPSWWPWGLLAAAIFLPRVIRSASGGWPWGNVIADAVNAVFFIFWVLWGMLPAIGTVLLWSDREGRHALNDEQRAAVKWFLPALLLAACAAVASPLLGRWLTILVMLPSLVVVYMVTAAYSIPPGTRRRVMGAITAATVAVSLIPAACVLAILLLDMREVPIRLSLWLLLGMVYSTRFVIAAGLVAIMADLIAKWVAGPQGTRTTIM